MLTYELILKSVEIYAFNASKTSFIAISFIKYLKLIGINNCKRKYVP